MPRPSVWFVRASMVYLVIGFLFGGLILAQKGIPYFAGVWALFPIHIEFLLAGWLMQLGMGVAYWILPRFGRGATRGPEAPVRAAFFLLNAGILLTIAQAWVPEALIAGRACELAGTAVFLAVSWRRVKPMVVGPDPASGA